MSETAIKSSAISHSREITNKNLNSIQILFSVKNKPISFIYSFIPAYTTRVKRIPMSLYFNSICNKRIMFVVVYSGTNGVDRKGHSTEWAVFAFGINTRSRGHHPVCHHVLHASLECNIRCSTCL